MAGGAATLVAALLARLEPSLRFRFSLIALGRGEKNKMAARLRPARKELARDAAHGPVGAGTPAIIREIGHFCPASIAHAHCGGQKQPNSL